MADVTACFVVTELDAGVVTAVEPLTTVDTAVVSGGLIAVSLSVSVESPVSSMPLSEVFP